MTGASAQVVTAGETMLCLSPHEAATFADSALCRRSFGGAESNTAIALARLGIPTRWFSRVGADPFGDELLAILAAEGVDARRAIRDEHAQTGVMFKERPTVELSRVRYYRAGSAASRLSPADVGELALEDAEVLHVTGVTCALGDGPRTFIREAVEQARAAGLTVSFDPNYRAALWPAREARDTYHSLLPLVDHLLLNLEEAQLLVSEDDPHVAARRLQEAGPQTVVVKRGRLGAVAACGEELVSVDAHPVRAVDSVGAGDAFNAGWIYSLIHGLGCVEALRIAAWVASQVAAHHGDYEGAPGLAQLRQARDPGAVAGDR